MTAKLKITSVATVLAAGLLIAPGTAGNLSGNGFFGVSPALAGNGNGGGPGAGNGGGHGGDHGGGHGGGKGPASTFGADKSLKTASRGGKSDTSHGHGHGFAQSFADSVGKGLGRASSGVQSMFDGVFGRGHSKGTATASVETTPEDVPTPTTSHGKSKSFHAGALSSLGRADQAYVHSQSPLMVAMRSYIQDYMQVVDDQGVEAAKTDPDLQAQLADIVSQFGKTSATQTQTTIDPTTLEATTTTTIDPAAADYVGGVLGDGSEGTKMSDIRGMLDSQSSTTSTTDGSTTQTSQTTASTDETTTSSTTQTDPSTTQTDPSTTTN